MKITTHSRNFWVILCLNMGILLTEFVGITTTPGS
jgi:hypothetical protein